MATNLLEIQNRISAFLEANASAPSDGSMAWARRASYVNRAQQMWSEVLDWRNLYKEYNALASAPSGLSTHALPADFRKLAGQVVLGGLKFTDLPPYERIDVSSNDRISYLMGSPGSYNLILKWTESPDGLSSITVPYYYTPASLTTQGAISPIPDPEYLVAKAIGMELRSLTKDHDSANVEDARAEMILRNMIASENIPPFGSERGRIKTQEERMGFTFGEDG